MEPEPTEEPKKTFPGDYGRELERERDSRKRELDEMQEKAEALQAELKTLSSQPNPEVLAARAALEEVRGKLAARERDQAAAALKVAVIEEAIKQGVIDIAAVLEGIDFDGLDADSVKKAVKDLIGKTPGLIEPVPVPPTPGEVGQRRRGPRPATPDEQMAAMMRNSVGGRRGGRR